MKKKDSQTLSLKEGQESRMESNMDNFKSRGGLSKILLIKRGKGPKGRSEKLKKKNRGEEKIRNLFNKLGEETVTTGKRGGK